MDYILWYLLIYATNNGRGEKWIPVLLIELTSRRSWSWRSFPCSCFSQAILKPIQGQTRTMVRGKSWPECNQGTVEASVFFPVVTIATKAQPDPATASAQSGRTRLLYTTHKACYIVLLLTALFKYRFWWSFAYFTRTDERSLRVFSEQPQQRGRWTLWQGPDIFWNQGSRGRHAATIAKGRHSLVCSWKCLSRMHWYWQEEGTISGILPRRKALSGC